MLRLAPGNPGTLQVHQNHHAGLQECAHAQRGRTWQFSSVTEGVNWGLISPSASSQYGAFCERGAAACTETPCLWMLITPVLLHASCPDSGTQCLGGSLFCIMPKFNVQSARLQTTRYFFPLESWNSLGSKGRLKAI